MTLINATKKVWSRLGKSSNSVLAVDDTILGPWCVHLYYFYHKQFIILTNERTLFTSILPARCLSDLATYFPKAVDDVLQKCEIRSLLRNKLITELSEIQFSDKTNRQVLGSINDFIKCSKYVLEDVPNISLSELSFRMCQMPCSPINMKSPRDVTKELLSSVAA
jgi:hypothetical protein